MNIYMYVLLCSSHSFKHVSLNNKDKFCLYNLFKIVSSFLISVSKENSAFVVFTITSLSSQLRMHLNGISSIAFHLKNHSIPKSKF